MVYSATTGIVIPAKKLSTLNLARPIVLTGGGFDLLHIGHVRFLSDCKKMGKTLVVLVSSDKRLKVRKGSKRPIISEEQRATLLTYLSSVDVAFVSDIPCEDKRVIDRLKPDILVLSKENQSLKKTRLEKSLGKKRLKALKVVFVDTKSVPGVGTCNTVQRILKLYK